MTNKTVTLIGATGLIGSHILELLAQDISIGNLRVLVRRPIAVAHPGAQVIVLDFADTNAFEKAIDGSDIIFCAVGTTQNKVKGDKAAYRKVDHDIPVNAARLGAASGCGQFLLVSSVGANAQSNNFYLQLKGEVEDAVQHSGIPSVSIFRPSLLLGNRKEFRIGEKISKPLMRAVSFILPSKYKPIEASDVARAMVAAAKTGRPGFTIYQYKEMQGLS